MKTSGNERLHKVTICIISGFFLILLYPVATVSAGNPTYCSNVEFGNTITVLSLNQSDTPVVIPEDITKENIFLLKDSIPDAMVESGFILMIESPTGPKTYQVLPGLTEVINATPFSIPPEIDEDTVDMADISVGYPPLSGVPNNLVPAGSHSFCDGSLSRFVMMESGESSDRSGLMRTQNQQTKTLIGRFSLSSSSVPLI